MKSRLLAYALAVTPLAAVFAQSAPPIPLVGVNNYYTYAAKTKQVLQNADLPAEATLRMLDGDQIELTLREWMGDEPRDTVLVGKCTPGGAVKATFDFALDPVGLAEFLDYVAWHTGCTISGHFPVFHGTFDGQRLVLITEFNSQCPNYTPTNDIFPTPVDGPIHWRWTFDLMVR